MPRFATERKDRQQGENDETSNKVKKDNKIVHKLVIGKINKRYSNGIWQVRK